MAINRTGNVGIGTTNPSYKLEVNSGTSDWPARFISSDDKAGIIIADNDTVNYLVSRNSFLSIGSISDLSATNLNVKSSGEVGISPASCTPTAGDMSSGDSQNTPIIHVKGSGTSATGAASA